MLLTGSIPIIFSLLFIHIVIRFSNYLDLENFVMHQNKKEKHQ